VDKPITSILNVDECAPGLYARTEILRQAGFDVLEATTGSQTLKLVSEHKPGRISFGHQPSRHTWIRDLPAHPYESRARRHHDPAWLSIQYREPAAGSRPEHRRGRLY